MSTAACALIEVWADRAPERVQRRVQETLRRMHALFTPDQRARLAYLLRTGTLAM